MVWRLNYLLQRWLSIRIDFMGAIMVCTIAVMAAVGINGITPSQIGLVLTYTTMLTQLFGMLTRLVTRSHGV
jgi:ABC-type uncharacterized transport system permease subunit